MSVGPAEQRTLESPSGGQLTVSTVRYYWHPPGGVAAHLPTGFSLSMECMTGPDAVRRFVPVEGSDVLILYAALGGAALQMARNNLSRTDRNRFRTARILSQVAPRLRERLGREFHRASDLYTHHDGVRQTVLPDDLGLGRDGAGTKWAPAELLEHGRIEAAARNLPSDEMTRIRLGLLAAARRNPVDASLLSVSEARALVRLALFAPGPTGRRPDPEVRGRVEDRLWRAVDAHLEDSTGEFNRWFFDNFDDVVHAIAKQKKNGGPIPREIVRQVILDLVFQSFIDTGECVSRQLAAFVEALPEPLNGIERPLFDVVYRGQPYLGGLPLILLRDRFPFLREAILDLWNAPTDPDQIGTLLRLLAYYGAMADNRRAADRHSKARSLIRNVIGRLAVGRPLDSTIPDRARSQPEWLIRIAMMIGERSGSGCACGTTRHWHVELLTAPTEDPAVFDVGCEQCEQWLEHTMSWREIKDVLK